MVFKKEETATLWHNYKKEPKQGLIGLMLIYIERTEKHSFLPETREGKG